MTPDHIKQLESVDFMFPDSKLGGAYCQPNDLKTLDTPESLEERLTRVYNEGMKKDIDALIEKDRKFIRDVFGIQD